MLGAGGVGGDKGQVDVGRGDAGQVNLGLFRGFLYPLHRHFVALQVYAGLRFKRTHDPIHNPLVKVIAA